jgi:hypothetical protein
MQQLELARLVPKSDDLPAPVIDFSVNACQLENAKNKPVIALGFQKICTWQHNFMHLKKLNIFCDL